MNRRSFIKGMAVLTSIPALLAGIVRGEEFDVTSLPITVSGSRDEGFLWYWVYPDNTFLRCDDRALVSKARQSGWTWTNAEQILRCQKRGHSQ